MKITQKRTLISALAAWLLAASMLASCGIASVVTGGATAATPSTAAINAVVEQESHGNFTLDQNSIQVLQSQQLAENYVIVQVAYQGFRVAQRELCLATQATLSSQGGWRTSGGVSGCSPLGQNSEVPLEVGQSTNSGGGLPGDLGYTAVNGFINDTQIKNVSVTWQDGQVQQAIVGNGAYLAARLGKQAFQTIQGLNENGEVVFTHEFTPPAPGKTAP